MLRLGSLDDIKLFKEDLFERLKEPSFRISRSNVTLPNGQLKQCKIRWLQSNNISAFGIYLWKPKGENRWGVWLFVRQSGASSGLTPCVEINFPKVTAYRNRRELNIAGRVLCDDTGRCYIAHRGGLGGGRRVVSRISFRASIQNFEYSQFHSKDNRVHEAFVLGAVDDPSLFKQLHAYAIECVRIRQSASKPSPDFEHVASVTPPPPA